MTCLQNMDGIEVTQLILKQFPAALIMVTSHGQEEMALNALKAGTTGYVLKPFRQDALQEVI